jgi:hypothetical protein
MYESGEHYVLRSIQTTKKRRWVRLLIDAPSPNWSARLSQPLLNLACKQQSNERCRTEIHDKLFKEVGGEAEIHTMTENEGQVSSWSNLRKW